jgi:NADP-dependent 3-hydroxy acid dehydrogenase YdfG
MKDFFKDKVVIVTGASSGTGASLVREFLNRGSKVVMAARDEARMLESKKAYYEQG